MKLTDYVARFLKKQGIRHVFGLTGGAVVHLFDSAARTPGIRPIFNHHEQASALAAQAYARVKGLGAAFVTTGPGGTNALTGVCAAWLDSIPCLFISGQARIEHSSRGKGVRQIGTQELDIVSLVSSVTKHAVMLEDPSQIRRVLEEAVFLAKTGRPGPVWIDIPLNFQWAQVDPEKLERFHLPAGKMSGKNTAKAAVDRCFGLMAKAERPLVVVGHGVRLARAESELKRFLGRTRWPFVSSWNASDILPTDHPLYAGRPGIAGQRGANLAVQNCDLLLALGSHLSLPLTGAATGLFARAAKKIVVDVDPAELANRNLTIDEAVSCDVKIFLGELNDRFLRRRLPDPGVWSRKCSEYRSRYNTVRPGRKSGKKRIDPYLFVDKLSDELGSGDLIVVDGGGTVVYTAFQAFKTKPGQRLMISAGLCAMGTGLPESIGACLARGAGRTICLCGDGSIQLNIQELQTIFHHKLPIKIFIFNNGGYLSIRHTQRDFLGSRFTGSQKKGGLSLPDILKVAAAYGLKTDRIVRSGEMKSKIRRVLLRPGPVVCELLLDRGREVEPRLGFDKRPDGTYAARPLEDMKPYLGRREFAEAMLVK